MKQELGERMFASLPAVYEAADATGDLARLLGVFEALFFESEHGDPARLTLPGIESGIHAIPALFAPIGSPTNLTLRTPDSFMHWMAAWLAFEPHALFTPEALRRIAAGIVPLYSWRGTRENLRRLIALCFESVHEVHIDDRPSTGFTVGQSLLGEDTRLAQGRAFFFKVDVHTGPPAHAPGTPDDAAAFERQLRAVIDFAKPAHTAYELRVHLSPQAGWPTAKVPGRQ
ncbi:hypothetical protein [Variovorax sp. J22R115]|uniref:hypothetical protein n=1 Tax=Variovorax sp. J22R115 TaxID=3053509 RepID=UPI002578047C|nr:hypothetical protein [Variovorax sp. J22R115]MDM0047921.1 hypothetical protein [Variovorax sp. J22R115]